MSNDVPEKWLAVFKKIENALFDLRADQVVFRGFMEIVESNPALPDNNLFIVWAWRNYLFTAAIAIRRQISIDSRDVSLANLLEDIKKEPHILSRQRYASLFKGTGFENDFAYINQGFDSVVGEGKNFLDQTEIAKDVDNLRTVAESLRVYANKTLAHADKNAESIQTLPTIKDLNDSMDLIEKIFKKYYFILTASNIEFPRVAQVPWKEIFLKPWKLDRRNLA